MYMKKSNETSTVHTRRKAGDELRGVAGAPTEGPDGFGIQYSGKLLEDFPQDCDMTRLTC